MIVLVHIFNLKCYQARSRRSFEMGLLWATHLRQSSWLIKAIPSVSLAAAGNTAFENEVQHLYFVDSPFTVCSTAFQRTKACRY